MQIKISLGPNEHYFMKLSLVSKLYHKVPISIKNSSQYFFGCTTCRGGGVLVAQPEIEPMSPALKAQSLNSWTDREVP